MVWRCCTVQQEKDTEPSSAHCSLLLLGSPMNRQGLTCHDDHYCNADDQLLMIEIKPMLLGSPMSWWSRLRRWSRQWGRRWTIWWSRRRSRRWSRLCWDWWWRTGNHCLCFLAGGQRANRLMMITIAIAMIEMMNKMELEIELIRWLMMIKIKFNLTVQWAERSVTRIRLF